MRWSRQEATEIATTIASLERWIRERLDGGQRIGGRGRRCVIPSVGLAALRPVQRGRERWSRWHERSGYWHVLWRSRTADVPNGIRAHERFYRGCTPQVRAVDLDVIAHMEVPIAEPGLGAIGGDAVGPLAEASDAHAETKARRAARGVGEAAGSIRNDAVQPNFDRHRNGSEKLRKNRAARSPTCESNLRRDADRRRETALLVDSVGLESPRVSTSTESAAGTPARGPLSGADDFHVRCGIAAVAVP